jgi:Ran GTPase-activating protein (RanGAP) involved in mRNA processing and transport
MSAVLLTTMQCVDAVKKQKSADKKQKPAETVKSSNGQSSSQSKSNNSAAEESTVSLFPFEKSTTDILPGKVAGILVKSSKIILLGDDYVYSEKPSKEDEDFSDMNFFRQYPKLVSIELNGLMLTPAMLENLQKFAQQEIKSVIIRNCTVAKDENYDLVADFFGKHTQLESVTVTFPDLVGEGSTKLVSAFQGHKNLKFMNLLLGEISDEAVGHLAEVLTGNAETLQGVSLGIGKITGKEEESYEHIADAINKLEKLESLELAFMSLPEAAFAHVAQCIKDHKLLKTLRLFFGDTSDHNHIKLFEHTEDLQKSLESLENLEILDVSANDFPQESIQLIAMSLKKMKKLKTLNVSGNPIDAKSAAVFAESFGEVSSSLTTLIANSCSMDDTVIAALLGKAENVASLQYLYLRGNSIKDGMKNLAVSVMSDLKVIDISGNEIGYDGVLDFVDKVADHKNLQAVNFKNNIGINDADDEEKSRKHDELEKKRIEKKVRVAFFGV